MEEMAHQQLDQTEFHQAAEVQVEEGVETLVELEEMASL